jgi:hypothetical protein
MRKAKMDASDRLARRSNGVMVPGSRAVWWEDMEEDTEGNSAHRQPSRTAGTKASIVSDPHKSSWQGAGNPVYLYHGGFC